VLQLKMRKGGFQRKRLRKIEMNSSTAEIQVIGDGRDADNPYKEGRLTLIGLCDYD
jgi:hypothetical protein